jgi:hypothetical protein
MSEDNIEQIVEEAKKPGTFNIINILKERAYPKEEIIIYLDEATAYNIANVDEKIKELSEISEFENKTKIDELTEKRNNLLNVLNQSKYVFTISGISEGLREDLQEQAVEKFPIEYEEEKNPFTGEVTKKEIDNSERDRFFTMLLWHEHIQTIVNADGDVQDKVTMDDVIALREMLPLSAITNITRSIEKLRMATAVFLMSVDEDFLAKS